MASALRRVVVMLEGAGGRNSNGLSHQTAALTSLRGRYPDAPDHWLKLLAEGGGGAHAIKNAAFVTPARPQTLQRFYSTSEKVDPSTSKQPPANRYNAEAVAHAAPMFPRPRFFDKREREMPHLTGFVGGAQSEEKTLPRPHAVFPPVAVPVDEAQTPAQAVAAGRAQPKREPLPKPKKAPDADGGAMQPDTFRISAHADDVKQEVFDHFEVGPVFEEPEVEVSARVGQMGGGGLDEAVHSGSKTPDLPSVSGSPQDEGRYNFRKTYSTFTGEQGGDISSTKISADPPVWPALPPLSVALEPDGLTAHLQNPQYLQSYFTAYAERADRWNALPF